MSAPNRPLNTRQLDVLRWIADGCEPDAMTGDTYKTSAVALQSRRLVKVSKKRGVWSANVTDAGRYYLEHGGYPAGHRLDADTRVLLGVRAAARSSLDADRTPPRSGSPTVRLIDEVVAAGGMLKVDRHSDGRDFQALVRSAVRFDKVPAGRLLVIDHGSGWANPTIRLVDEPTTVSRRTSVPVPRDLRRAHPVIRSLQRCPQINEITFRARSRALRLLQALPAEASRRGHLIGLPAVGDKRASNRPLIVLEVHDHLLGVGLRQELDRVRHEPTATELLRAQREPWYRVPTHTKEPSDRLSIYIIDGREYQQSNWSDNKRRSLDDCLGDILREIEVRAHFAVEAQLERERAEADRRSRWEAAVEQAKLDLRDHHRTTTFVDQAQAWQRAQLLRAYLDAITAATPDPDADTAAWLEWCRMYTERTDPLASPLNATTDPEPTPEALEPFLRGWSAYGPEQQIPSWR